MQRTEQTFFTFHQKKRPYIILKWAESQDGFIALMPHSEKPSITMKRSLSGLRVLFKTIINGEAKSRLFWWYTNSYDDNPKLDIRDWTGNNPIRLVLDQNKRIPVTAMYLKIQKLLFYKQQGY
jgi:diaminohydroxyphosphoribosylaminopyrimidine deaminase/5-amino-6-(5-phosphoribosylamino)uracil reductase